MAPKNIPCALTLFYCLFLQEKQIKALKASGKSGKQAVS